MNLFKITDFIYTILPAMYSIQLYFFNGNHFKILKQKLRHLPQETILEIGCGTAPLLHEFHPKHYVGIDIDKRFLTLAKKIYKKSDYRFYLGDATKRLNIEGTFDLIISSHTTHHFSDRAMKAFLQNLQDIKFKYLVIYDGKPIGPLAPLLTKLDLGARFRELEEFFPFFEKNFTIVHSEVFRSNRPFYKYPLLILTKRQKS